MCQTLVNFFFFQSDAFKSRFHKIHTQKRAISQLIIWNGNMGCKYTTSLYIELIEDMLRMGYI